MKKLDLWFDPARLVADLQAVTATHALDHDQRQLCVTSRAGALDPLRDGAGRAMFDPRSYRTFNEEFAGTVFEEFVKTSPIKLGRVRLMLLPPRACYSFHSDTEPRLHLAIKTNPDAFLLVEDDGLRRFHVPVDGHVYWVDTRRPHTAMNGGIEDRIHLVACVL